MNHKRPAWVKLVERLSSRPTLCATIRLANHWSLNQMRTAVSGARYHGYRPIHEYLANGDERPRWYMRLDRPSYERAKEELGPLLDILDDTEYITLREAAAHSGVHEKTIGRWIHNGRVEAKKLNGHRWVDIGTLPRAKEATQVEGGSAHNGKIKNPAGRSCRSNATSVECD